MFQTVTIVPQDGWRHHQGQHGRRLRAAAHPLHDGCVREGVDGRVALLPLLLGQPCHLAMGAAEVRNSYEKS